MPWPSGWCSSTAPASPGVTAPARPWWWKGLSGIDGMIQIQKMLQGMASVTKVAIGRSWRGQGHLQSLSLQQGQGGSWCRVCSESRRQSGRQRSGLRCQWSQPAGQGMFQTARHDPGGSLSAALVVLRAANIAVKGQRGKSNRPSISLAGLLPDDETFVVFVPAANAHLITRHCQNAAHRSGLALPSISGGQRLGTAPICSPPPAPRSQRPRRRRPPISLSISSNSWTPACWMPSKTCPGLPRRPGRAIAGNALCGSRLCSTSTTAGKGRGTWWSPAAARRANFRVAAAGSLPPSDWG